MPQNSLFRPIRVGTMQLDHRIMMPPHSGGRGSLVGSESSFNRFVAYWVERVKGGAQWVGGAPNFVRNPLIPGFEPTGVGANGPGTFRAPNFVERVSRITDAVHAAGGYFTTQMGLQGGMPLSPSPTLSGYHDHDIPHVLDTDEIDWLVKEYGESARLAADGGVDVIEMHSNHDDLLQWFLSPLTNRREDGYGGSFENRRRFLREVVESIRAHIDRPITLGLRLCIDEMIDGGYTLQDCQRLLETFTADGTVDYFSLDVGNNWGAPSYVAPHVYPEGQWAALCGQAKQATSLPVLYAGRVNSPEVAAEIIEKGHADVVGIVRAMIAEPNYVNNLRENHTERTRPCIGVQDCLSRRVAEGLPFACAVNPTVGREHEGALPAVTEPKSILVIGAGPGGSEAAALAAERGHRVTLWERDEAIGGQLKTAAKARMNAAYQGWIDWQQRRLESLDIDLQLGRTATVEDVIAHGPDVVIVATGAVPRLPDATGLDAPNVVLAGAVLQGITDVGKTVLVVSEDNRPAPLAVADHLAGLGHDVTITYRTPAPSPLVNKYMLGGLLARMDAEGVRLLPTTRLVGVQGSTVTLANTYSGREWSVEGIDTVVLATGSEPDDGLHRQLKRAGVQTHLLGDSYAPRRVIYATRQAWSLVETLD